MDAMAKEYCETLHLLPFVSNKKDSRSNIVRKINPIYQRNRIGRQIARRRLLAKTKQKRICPETIFRRREDLSTSQQYTNCSFLDQNDVIVATTCTGEADILRLPRYYDQKDGTDLASSMRRLAGSGIQLAGNLHLSDSTGRSHNSIYDGTSSHMMLSTSTKTPRFKIQSLQNGQAFAVGMPSGIFSIFCTERASSIASYSNHANNLNSSNVLQDNIRGLSQPISSRFITNGYNIPCLQNRQCSSVTSSSSFLESPQNLYHSTWNQENEQIRSPHGIYQSSQDQDYEHLRLPHRLYQSLWDQDHEHLRSPRHSNILAQESLENARHDKMPFHYTDALWDFYETPSTLLAAHSDPDTASLAVMDSRIPSSQNNSVLQISLEKHQQASITATCFLSSNIIVTAQHQGRSNLRRPGNCRSENLIKLWDIRMPGSISSRTSRPQETIGWSDPAGSYIAYISPSIAASGTVMVTTEMFLINLMNHSFLDIGRKEVVKRICPEDNNCSTSNVFAVTPDQEFIACYERESGHNVMQSFITLYDQTDFVGRSCTIDQIQKPIKVSSSRRKKRRKLNDAASLSMPCDDVTKIIDVSRNSRSTDQLKPDLLDRHGLKTHLSCMAVNDSGTTIIGGSYDGDLFALRAH